MASNQLEALERVCDKRHARYMAQGQSLDESSKRVVAYLDGWLSRQISPYKIEFGSALREGYAA